jgi:TetR/AcrR family transcriptional repressor of nem operon
MVAGTDSARQRLIDSAIRLIHAGSYGAVSVNDLCADAGVKKGSFYHFFPTKRDLALAAIDAYWERHRTGLFEGAFAADLPPLDRIARFFDRLTPWIGKLAADGMPLGCPFGNLGVEMATQDDVIRVKVQEVFGHVLGYFESAIRDAHAEDESGRVDAHAAAGRILAYLEGLHVLAKVNKDPQLFARSGGAATALIDADGTG